MKICVASGKGGTGKTTVATNLALSIDEPVQLIDCDVEEPNAHLLLHPELEKTEPVYTEIPLINRALCTNCSACSQFCQFHAIFTTAEKILIFPELCHSCGGCAKVCPSKAITWEKYKIGTLHFSTVDDIELIYGELEIGKPMSVPIIKAAKKYMCQNGLIILDSPPGTSCPFVETVRGSDFCILVTEPTPFGLNDLALSVETLEQLEKPFGVVVNRDGLGDNNVYAWLEEKNIPLLMRIPFDKEIARTYSQSRLLAAEDASYKKKFLHLLQKIETLCEK